LPNFQSKPIYFRSGVALLLLIAYLLSAVCAQARLLEIEHEIYRFDKERNIHTYSNPRVKIDNIQVSSSRLHYDKASDLMNFSGNIIIRTPKLLLTANTATFDLDKSVATLSQTTLYDEANAIFVEASRIEQLEEDLYIIYDGSVTFCKPGEKAWEVRGRKITYRVDDFAYSISTSLHFYTLPVFYTPFFSWPTKKGRASGFLIPGYTNIQSSNKSKSYGNRLQIPYFIDLDQDHDLTITADILQERGLGIGLDYQYAFLPGMRGSFQSWYLDENQKDRDLDYETLGTLNAGTDELDLQPTRYKYLYNHRQNMFFNGQLFFSQLGNSDNEINKEFFDSNVIIETHFAQALSMVFPWSSGSLAFSYETRDNFVYTSVFDPSNNADTYLNRHPSISVSQRFSRIADLPLSVNLGGSFINYERTYGWNGAVSKGSFGLSAPFYLDFLNVLPSYQRDFYDFNIKYQPSPTETVSSSIESFPKNFGWFIDRKGLEFNFEIYRLFYNDDQVANRKLSFRPRIYYTEISDVDQSLGTTPGFESAIYSQKNLTYRLETLFLTKDLATNQVRTFMGFYLTQIYNLHREGEQTFLSPQPTNQETAPGDPRLPLRLQIFLSPVNRFSAGLFYRYDHQSESIVETVLSLGASSSEGSSFALSYTNNTVTYHDLDNTNHPAAKSYSVSHLLKLGDRWDLTLTGTWDQNRNTLNYQYGGSAIERLDRQLTLLAMGLQFRHGCYNFIAGYREEILINTVKGVTAEYLDQRATFTISIPVLPTAAGGVSSVPVSQEYLIN
jgi:lipopolysaccharide assembly outer membrane protein LptD (OstA)